MAPSPSAPTAAGPAGDTLSHVISHGSGNRAAVFLHGVGLSAASFRPLIEVLGAEGRAVAIPLPGYDGAPMFEPYTMAGLAIRLGQILDGLGIARADLVGHSHGGMLALEFAAGRPERVGSLTLVATTPVFGSKDGGFEEQFLAERFGPLDAGKTLAEIAPAMVRGAMSPNADPKATAAAVAANGEILEAAYRASVRSLIGFDRRHDLKAIGVPTLCVAGAEDKLAPPRSMERMAQAIPGARFEVFAGAGHLPYVERPAEFAKLLHGFLSEARAAPH
ncbi:Pimeloyl-ACP methyl ester carboxylesterase [Rhizobiales bacterium GAS191]|nr:Pimeloyl-ACP methyl ester carboxylesterase [Rhizobiales bacterium GAS191]